MSASVASAALPPRPDCDPQLCVTDGPDYADYARAAVLLWGDAGEVAAAEFARHNRVHFAGFVPPMPIVISLTAYGHCLGLTRAKAGAWLESPRISLAPEVFRGSAERADGSPGRTRGGPRMASDVILHEMVHAALLLRGADPSHNGEPWCEAITALSPAVLGREITARPVKPRRVANPERERDPRAPKTLVRRLPEPGALPQAALARWPHSLRPPGWYDSDRPIPVPTY